ncbi:tRNA lysidine(34) synthetase TilS [Georgenia yuyongxinii]|uniref:tRNA(Ile)-lysidine synthase n=1 Tax=Georgenia yuyongxinii TaxID=2589797 RepID=A0A552WKL2_9MICO|nr:tRNA lysidine(34) synthetase TilS [Georgenia yuyongxinii]TRW43204.1 tRNA lysidine(34) synthetase TilS [Georgenia yuyongxinii]
MSAPHPAVAAARSAVRAALADLPPGARVLVACSGGADSLALAAATAFVAARAGWLAGAVIVDHRLQESSAADAAQAAEQCADLGLDPVEVRGVDVPGGRSGRGAGGPEAAARTARYDALAAAARDAGAAAVVLGHTLDDQAETVLLGLARGSGARSLAGMAPVHGLWRRPLLGLRRAQTEQVCRVLGQEFVTDPTNRAEGPWRAADGTALRRAAVRERVLPALTDALGPGVVPALGRTAAQLRRDGELLDTLAADLLAAARAAAASVALDEAARAERPSLGRATVVGHPRSGQTPSLDSRSGDDEASEAAGLTRVDETGGPDHPSGESLVLEVAVLAAAHPALRTRALRGAALQAGATPGALTAAHLEALDAVVAGYHGQGPVQLPGGVVAHRRCGRLSLDPR